MNIKSILILAIATGVIIGGSILVTNVKQNNVTETTTGKILFDDLESSLNDITHVEIVKRKNIASISKVDGAWVVTNKNNRPADLQQLKQLFFTLANATILERKTSLEKQYKKLKVEDVDGKKAFSISATLKDSNGAVLVSAIIGKPRAAKSVDNQKAFYIRRTDRAQSWLVTGKIKLSAKAASWLAKDLISIDQQRIKSVIVVHPQDPSLKIEKNNPLDNDYTMLDIPEGMEIRNVATVNNFALGLKEIKLEDVLPRDEIEFDAALSTNTKFETFDGLVIDVLTMKKKRKWYTQFKASFNENAVAAIKEMDVKATQLLKSPDEVKTEIAKMNEKFQDWTYVLPGFKAINFHKKIIDLAKDKR